MAHRPSFEPNEYVLQSAATETQRERMLLLRVGRFVYGRFVHRSDFIGGDAFCPLVAFGVSVVSVRHHSIGFFDVFMYFLLCDSGDFVLRGVNDAIRQGFDVRIHGESVR